MTTSFNLADLEKVSNCCALTKYNVFHTHYVDTNILITPIHYVESYKKTYVFGNKEI